MKRIYFAAAIDGAFSLLHSAINRLEAPSNCHARLRCDYKRL